MKTNSEREFFDTAAALVIVKVLGKRYNATLEGISTGKDIPSRTAFALTSKNLDLRTSCVCKAANLSRGSFDYALRWVDDQKGSKAKMNNIVKEVTKEVKDVIAKARLAWESAVASALADED
jgi:hypothetical protein